MHRCRHRLFILLVAFTWSFEAPASAADARDPRLAAGAWQAVDGSPSLVVEPTRILIWDGEHVNIVPIWERRPEGWLLSVEGRHRLEPVTLRDGRLVLGIGPEHPAEAYRALPEAPEELRLEPLDLADPRPLPPGRVAQIQAEIAERLQRDQAVLTAAREGGAAAEEQRDQVMEDNLRYLLSLLRDVGWLDRERFGSKTSVQAAIMAKHFSDLPLMLAILPLFERDFENHSTDGQTYAIVVDATQLMLGRPQRYGSQVETDVDGHPIVAPLEEPGQVDARRAAIGIEPLAEYLALVSEYFFDGAPIRGQPTAP